MLGLLARESQRVMHQLTLAERLMLNPTFLHSKAGAKHYKPVFTVRLFWNLLDCNVRMTRCQLRGTRCPVSPPNTNSYNKPTFDPGSTLIPYTLG